MFSSPKSRTVVTSILVTRYFVISPIFALKYIPTNLLNSGVSIKWVVIGVLFSRSVTYVLRAAVVTKSVLTGISFSISVIFVL